MFSPEERAALRSELLALAAMDTRITGTAITGSAAADREDVWSDIDLAFGVDGDVGVVLADWTARIYQRGAVHHVDVRVARWVYRVFLLANTLQVDLAFAPSADFRPLATTFRLVSGKAGEMMQFPGPDPRDIAGMGWLYALHARSAVARGLGWQAEHMISGLRDQALALACLRHGAPSAHGKGIDQLPAGVTAPFEESLVRSLAPEELARAFRVAVEGLLREIRHADGDLAARVEGPLLELAR